MPLPLLIPGGHAVRLRYKRCGPRKRGRQDHVPTDPGLLSPLTGKRFHYKAELVKETKSPLPSPHLSIMRRKLSLQPTGRNHRKSTSGISPLLIPPHRRRADFKATCNAATPRRPRLSSVCTHPWLPSRITFYSSSN